MILVRMRPTGSKSIYLALIVIVLILLLVVHSGSARHLKLDSFAKKSDIQSLKRYDNISLKLCHEVDLDVHKGHFCCSGIVLPRGNPRYICRDGQPYKRRKSQIKNRFRQVSPLIKLPTEISRENQFANLSEKLSTGSSEAASTDSRQSSVGPSGKATPKARRPRGAISPRPKLSTTFRGHSSNVSLHVSPALQNSLKLLSKQLGTPSNNLTRLKTGNKDADHNSQQNDPVPASRLTTIVWLSTGSVCFLIAVYGVAVVIVKKKCCKTPTKHDIGQGQPLRQDLKQSSFNAFVSYQDDISIDAIKVKEFPSQESTVILLCDEDRLSLQSFEETEYGHHPDRAPEETLSLDIKNISLQDFSSLPSSSFLGFLDKDIRMCPVTNILELPNILPHLINKIGKLSSLDDINITDSLFKEKSTQTSLKKSNYRNLLGGSWDRGGSFDKNGGTLDTVGSAVSLVIPPDAVEDGQVASLHGKIFTNLSHFNPVFKLQKGERFVSPVVEFIESNGITFKKHMIIKIPISTGCDQDSSLKVYCVPGNGDLSVSTIPRIDKHGNKPDVYFDVEEHGFVFVYTKHFTAFVCTSCDRRQIHLKGLVMRKIQEAESCPSQNALPFDITLRLYICDSLYLIPDFRTALEQRDMGQGWQRENEKTISLGKSAHEDDELSTTVTLQGGSENNWEERMRPNGQPWILDNGNKTLSELTCCNTQNDYPEIGGEWVFKSKGLSDYFRCTMDVEHVPESGQKQDMNAIKRRVTTFDVKIDGRRCSASETVRRKDNADEKLCSLLANKLHIRDVKPFARSMDVDETTISDIFSDHSGDGYECKYQVIKKALQKCGPVGFRENLSKTLLGIARRDVVEEIGGAKDGTNTINGARAMPYPETRLMIKTETDV